MAILKFQVISYEVKLSRQLTVGSNIKFYALICCYGKDGTRFCNYFLRPDSPVENNVYNPTTKWATAFLPAEQFPWYLDLLRNEKPVFAYVNSDDPISNHLYTGKEPVGEGEPT